jgi:pentafunctional AROM polypeptide
LTKEHKKVVEAYAALELGILKTPAVIERLRRVLKLYQLPFAAPFGDLTPEKVDKLLDLCRADKKASARGEIRCVLLSGVGSVGPGITYSVPERLMRLLLSPACAVSPPERVAPTREVAVRVPGSKSVSNRVLLLAALGRGWGERKKQFQFLSEEQARLAFLACFTRPTRT